LAALNAFFALISPTLAHPTVDASDPRASIAANANGAPDKDRIEAP
jgi:hypothetical protein